jgi:predicted transcriptional regulator
MGVDTSYIDEQEVAHMEWEYRIEMIHMYGVASETIARRLNELGNHGWEAISTVTKSGDTAGVLMKRQKTK